MMQKIDRLLMRYLRRRGWVVFWLDEPARRCSAQRECPGVCWMALYEDERQAGNL